MTEIIIVVLIVLGIIFTMCVDTLCRKVLKVLRKEQSGYDWRVFMIAKDKYVIEHKAELKYLKQDLKIVSYKEATIYKNEVSARYALEKFIRDQN